VDIVVSCPWDWSGVFPGDRVADALRIGANAMDGIEREQQSGDDKGVKEQKTAECTQSERHGSPPDEPAR
jgi:hypothetical protein